MPVLGRIGFLGRRETAEICQEPVFHLGFKMQGNGTVNGTSVCPFSVQRGLQHRGVPLHSAGRVPPGQLRDSSQTHGRWLLHLANKVGWSSVYQALSSVLCISITEGTVSSSLFSQY